MKQKSNCNKAQEFSAPNTSDLLTKPILGGISMAEGNDKSEHRSVKRNICQERQIKVTRINYEYKSKRSESVCSSQPVPLDSDER